MKVGRFMHAFLWQKPYSPECATISAPTGATMFGHNPPADWAGELFKRSEDGESLVISILKNWEVMDLIFFMGDVKSG